MITHEELTDIAARAYEANLGGDDPMKEAVAAVVRALIPEMAREASAVTARAFYWTYDVPVTVYENHFKKLLGDLLE